MLSIKGATAVKVAATEGKEAVVSAGPWANNNQTCVPWMIRT